MKIKSMKPHFDWILSGEKAPKETNHISDPNAHSISVVLVSSKSPF